MEKVNKKISSQPAKVRTKLSAKPESRRCQAAALLGCYYGDLWKQQEMKSTKYSGLAQSHASLPTTDTRALTSTLCTRKLHCRMQRNWPSSSIEHKLHLVASHWARMRKEENIRMEEGGNKRYLRNQRKYVQSCQRSQGVKDAKRQLCQVVGLEISESSKRWNRSSIQGWLNLMPHCPPPPPLKLWFQLSALESCVVKYNKKLVKLIHRVEALSSCISLGFDKRREKKYQAGRRKRKMSSQPAKVRTRISAKSESRRCQAVALSAPWNWDLWKQQEMKSTNIQGWLNLMPHCHHH